MKKNEETVYLSDGWQYIDTDPGSECPVPAAEWRPITIPGDINSALVSDSRIPSPHIAAAGRDAYWISSREWWLKRDWEYQGDHSCIDLCLDGIDGPAEVFLNGVSLGIVRNAFHPHCFAIREYMQIGRNSIALRFIALDEELGGPRLDELEGWRHRRVLLRKPQYNFGWDWALPIPGIGVFGSIALEYHDGPRLRDVSVQGHINGRVELKFRLSPEALAGCRLRIQVAGHGADETEEMAIDSCREYTSLAITDPKFWWPRGMGEPALYSYNVKLMKGDRCIDEKCGHFGFREIRIEESPFTPEAGKGISFWFVVNGRRVFSKGANWIPTELWPADSQEAQYHFYLEKAAESHFNMLRVWGGGIYERDLFYDLCDQYGIMVWQDFMFASAGYPEEQLRSSIIVEAEYQLKRLRNHPCIALWCGCNEDVYSWCPPEGDGRNDCGSDAIGQEEDGLQVNRLRDDPRLYTMTLRGLTSKYSLDVPYVESSPQSHDDYGNTFRSGNAHQSCWKFALFQVEKEPWRFREHFDTVASFDSEFCIQGPCSEETLKEFLTEDHLWPPDEVWTYHIQRGHGRLPHHEQTLAIAGGVMGPINDLTSYVKHGQATHVEMMRAEYESARRDRPNNGGTMVWMFNDCWPTSNWSLIDYYREPKPSYYAAKRACAPVLPIIFARNGQIEYFLSNDTAEEVSVTVQYGMECFDGSRLSETRKTLVIPPVTTLALAEEEAESFGPDVYLYMRAVVDGQALPTVTYFPDGWKDVSWPAADCSLSVISSEETESSRWRTVVRIEARQFLRLAHLELPRDGGASWIDDNDFDLPKGETRTVTITSRAALTEKEIGLRTWVS